jgi:hypothetical protein
MPWFLEAALHMGGWSSQRLVLTAGARALLQRLAYSLLLLQLLQCLLLHLLLLLVPVLVAVMQLLFCYRLVAPALEQLAVLTWRTALPHPHYPNKHSLVPVLLLLLLLLLGVCLLLLLHLALDC